MGNRAVEGNFWAVLQATERAFPLLLGASVDRARELAASISADGNADFLRDLWVLQVYCPLLNMPINPQCLCQSKCMLPQHCQELWSDSSMIAEQQRYEANAKSTSLSICDIESSLEAWDQMYCIFLHVACALQGVSDGCLAIAADKVRTQPQIFGAYKRTAPMRAREQIMEFCAAVTSLQVTACTAESLLVLQHSLPCCWSSQTLQQW